MATVFSYTQSPADPHCVNVGRKVHEKTGNVIMTKNPHAKDKYLEKLGKDELCRRREARNLKAREQYAKKKHARQELARQELEEIGRKCREDAEDAKRARQQFEEAKRERQQFEEAKRARQDIEEAKRAYQELERAKRAYRELEKVKRAYQELEDEMQKKKYESEQANMYNFEDDACPNMDSTTMSEDMYVFPESPKNARSKKFMFFLLFVFCMLLGHYIVSV